ncbi:MAG TPA: SIMPL domain-containing protein, partial [Pirellulales bacterium]|nr:SIMPL domain-containing protein [Pirellulales bacterium]
EEYNLPLLATFVLEDAAELYELARRRAFQAARTSAAKLAELAELRLGPVEAMQELSAEAIPAMETWQDLDLEVEVPQQRAAAPQPAKLRLTSRTFNEIPVHVNLRVRFRTRPIADDAPSQTNKGKEE